MAMTDAVEPDLLDKVLEKFGLSERPALDLEGLSTAYNAWCESVSFDNVQKRVYMGENRSGPLPGIEPSEFLQNLVTHGTGGTCWPSSNGLWALMHGLVGHREQHSRAGVLVDVLVNRPCRHDKRVLVAPLEFDTVDDGGTLALDHVIDGAGGVLVGFGVDAGRNQLCVASHGRQDRTW